MYSWYSYNEVYHHGILGMKWGKRNGPPYPLQPGQHSASEKKAGWRKSLDKAKKAMAENSKRYDEERKKNLEKLSDSAYYKTYGSTKRGDKKKLEKYGAFSRWDSLSSTQKKAIIGVAAAAGITVGAAFMYNKIGRHYLDDVIKSGTTLQTLSFSEDRISLGEHFYATYLKNDRATMIDQFRGSGDPVIGGLKSKLETEVLKNIKVASPKTVANELKQFTEANKNNPEMSKAIYDYFSNASSPNVPSVTLFKDGVDVKVKDWQKFANEYITDLNFAFENSKYYNPENMPFVKEFYKHLAAKGYGGVKDFNDMGWTQAPVIIFDRSKIGETVVNNITWDDIDRAKVPSFVTQIVSAMGQKPVTDASFTGLYTAMIGAAGAAEYNAHQRKKEKQAG